MGKNLEKKGKEKRKDRGKEGRGDRDGETWSKGSGSRTASQCQSAGRQRVENEELCQLLTAS